MTFENIKLTCTILSPVHVGTGEEIAVYDYFIQSGLLIKVSMDRVIRSLSPDEIEEFNKLNDDGNYLGIRKFLIQKSRDRNWLTKVSDFTIPVSGEVEKKYVENIGNPENQLLIRLNQRTSISNNPIIPGSSIKGAIRTAILSKLGLQFDDLPLKPQQTEGKLLNIYKINKRGKRFFDVGKDPFKYLKISDVHFTHGNTIINTVKNIVKESDNLIRVNEMQMIHEVFNSFLTGTNLQFELTIRLAQMRVGGTILNKKYIIEACRQFYNDKLDREFNYFQDTIIEENILKIKDQIDFTNEFLIRVGRFSGKESITLDKHRKGKPSQTRNLADGKYPMGWILCKIVE